MRRVLGASLIMAGAAVAAGPPALGAQHFTVHPSSGDAEASKSSLYVANALLGGLAGGTARLLQGDVTGEELLASFLKGAAGGSLAYVGKWTAAQDVDGAALIGRQITSLGSSVVGNTVAGRPALSRLGFSLGPLRLYAGSEVADGVDWGLDVPAVVVGAYGLGASGWRLSLSETVSSGALSFQARDPGYSGFALAGTVFHEVSPDPERQRYVLAHERVHVLQLDQAYLSFSRPVEQAIVRRLEPRPHWLDRLEVNAVGFIVALLGLAAWEHEDRPWEKEAVRLGGGE